MFGSTQESRIQRINEQLATASAYLAGDGLSAGDRDRLQAIVRGLNAELITAQSRGQNVHRMAAEWKAAWEEVWGQFQADQNNDPFFAINLERSKKEADARANYIREANQAVHDQINEYYSEQRMKIVRELRDEEQRMSAELSRSNIDNLEYEKELALRNLAELEQKRIHSAAYTGEEIAAIQARFQEMRENIELNFSIEINQTTLDEARDAVKNWQEELSNSLLTVLLDLENFNDRAAVILSDLASQFLELSISAGLSGFEEFGRALGRGEDAATAFSQAMSNMAEQILRQLPTLFLQAGLQLIANGQWALGLGFIAAAGSSAIISGYIDGMSRHAKGNAFEYGQVANAYAAGGTFTNQIVSTPTFFRYGNELGEMGEAGPEAIVPLARMPNGDLGIQATGSGSRASVNVIIHNYSGEEVSQEETENADGSKDIEIRIGEALNRHIASGKADRAMAGRYGSRPVGV